MYSADFWVSLLPVKSKDVTEGSCFSVKMSFDMYNADFHYSNSY